MTTETRNTHPTDYYTDRAQRRTERRAARKTSEAWIGGIMLIGLGLIFLLQNTGALYLQNWWALFILLPALGSFGASFTEYRVSGRFNAKARGSLVAGLVFTAIAAVFLFNLNFSLLLPIILIVAGVAILFNSLLPD
jgi:uncharacterized integral membrane protein